MTENLTLLTYEEKYQFEDGVATILGMGSSEGVPHYSAYVRIDGMENEKAGEGMHFLREARGRLEGYLHAKKIKGETRIDRNTLESGWISHYYRGGEIPNPEEVDSGY